MKTLILSSVVALSAVVPLSGAAQVDPTGQSYNELVLGGESGGNQHATTDLGSATGMYQFTYGTLRDLGYISSGPDSVAFGEGEWQGVSWTGLDGVNSRQDFMDSMYAQDQALQRLTQNNLNAISHTYTSGEMVNGVPMTDGGAAYASHMLGAGGFQQWASCGFQASCLDAGQAAANNMTKGELQEHLMGRVAEGAGVDPSTITSGGYADYEVPPQALMPWTPAQGPAVIVTTS